MTNVWEHLTSGDFMPHGHCYLWLPEILWTNVTADFLIAAAYYSIPVSIVAFMRKRPDLELRAVPVLFSLFIFLCGTTHLFAIVTVWNGYYGIAGLLKAATAIVSIFTAVFVWKLLPQALAIPSNTQMQGIVDAATSELVDKNKALGRANEDVENFVSAASHDLKEPLRTLVAYSQLLEKDVGKEISDNAQRDLEHIVAAAKRMQTLVNDILDLSRSGNTEPDWQPVDMENSFRDVVETLKERIESLNADVSLKGSLPTILGDAVLIRHILINLLSNALKFRRDDVPPTVTLSASEQADGVWVFSIEDNGLGIDSSFAEKIFEPFKRLHGRDHSEGTGIGLAICKRAVEQHGGKIWVEPADKAGSIFKFTLQADPALKDDA